MCWRGLVSHGLCSGVILFALIRSPFCHYRFSLAGQSHPRRILQTPLWRVCVRLPPCRGRGLGQYLNFHWILLFLIYLSSPENKPLLFFCGGEKSPDVMSWGGYLIVSPKDFLLKLALFSALFSSFPLQIRILSSLHYHQFRSLLSWLFCQLLLDFFKKI